VLPFIDYLEGDACFDLQIWNESETAIARAIEGGCDRPDRARGILARAIAFGSPGRYDEAILVARMGLADARDRSQRCHDRDPWAALARDRPPGRPLAFDSATAESAGGIVYDARRTLIDVLLTARRFPEARAQVSEMEKSPEESVRCYLQTARIALAEGREDEARERLKAHRDAEVDGRDQLARIAPFFRIIGNEPAAQMTVRLAAELGIRIDLPGGPR
jgi:hypothetical protein